MSEKSIFEVCAAGFDASTDKTDHLVFWVTAELEQDVHNAIAGTGARLHGPLQGVDQSGVDFHLPGDKDAFAAKLKAPGAGAKTITVVVGAHGTADGCDAPGYAAFRVDEALLQRLSMLLSVVTEHGLSEVRMSSYPDWGPGDIESELRLQQGELVLLAGGSFRLTDYPKYGDYRIETRCLPLSRLREVFDSAADGDVVIESGDEKVRALYEGDHENDAELAVG